MKKKKREYEEDLYLEDLDDEDEIELMDLFFILRRNLKLIIGTAIPIIILGVLFAVTRPDIYKAEATLMVSSGKIYTATALDSGELSRNQKMVTTYTEIARSNSIMRSVIKKLDLDTTTTSLAKQIKVTPVEDTELIKISYEDKNPQKAAMLVNEVSNLFIMRAKDIMHFENLKVVEQARVPEHPQPKKSMIIVAVSIILGLMLGAFIAFALEFLHSKLRKPSDMEKILGVSILASIPDFTEDEVNK